MPTLKMLALTTAMLLFSALTAASTQLGPLYTNSRWIVDESGKRVKLRCINWAGHMEANIPEGLQHAALDDITGLIAKDFNCVRLTFSIDMALSPNEKVSKSFATLAQRAKVKRPADVDALWSSIVKKNNWIGDMSLIQTFGTVIDSLGSRGLRVILDNHVSKASWCCNLNDGNGWWSEAGPSGWLARKGYLQLGGKENSQYFKADEWLRGLAAMAKFAKGHSAVVGIGIRNEIRPSLNPLQMFDYATWKEYVTKGIDAVYNANPELLVIAGGTLSSTDLQFVRTRLMQPPKENWPNKFVWEAHTYPMSPIYFLTFKIGLGCEAWKTQAGLTWGFLLQQGKQYTAPVWVSEWGFSMTGGGSKFGIGNEDWVQCVVEYLESNDADWALWPLQADYYVRDGNVNADDPWGLLNADWTEWRNPKLRGLLRPILEVTQGPGI